jgi:hypothetical protein
MIAWSPDVLDRNAGVIGEVKNVASLSYTSQLRDDVLYAQKYGSTCNSGSGHNPAQRPAPSRHQAR